MVDNTNEQNKLKEKEEKEQASLRKQHAWSIKIQVIFLNLVCIIVCPVSAWSVIHYLRMSERSAHDNEQLVLSGVCFVVFLFLLWLVNKGGDMLMEKYLTWIARTKEKQSQKEDKKITDLNSALHAMSQKNGVVIWDTIWTFGVFFFTGCLIFKGGNKPLILWLLVVSFLMLFGGHYIGTRIWRRHRYEMRILKYTMPYLEIVSKRAYLASIDASIKRGVLGFTGLWMLTDEYIIGRLSDLEFQVVGIPRELITHCTFFFNKRIVSDEIPVGVLQCHLQDGKCVDMEIGRGEVCNQVLRLLNEYRIPWEKKEMQFT